MPRQKSPVKDYFRNLTHSLGLVDLHFHGAFGIDLMKADAAEFNQLSEKLFQNGIAGFCPTTLSAPVKDLEVSVARIGKWIASKSAPGARPLGIHLEGPFIEPGACGAHPPDTIRPLDMKELARLWEASHGTLKILTIAPETLGEKKLRQLVTWSRSKKIKLSLGHSKATEAQAAHAFEHGFSGITHSWNALPFHHRSPGPLGAALGRPDISVELILDGVHVAPTVARWTTQLHPRATCFVSDCVPAAATGDDSWHSFGSLRVKYSNGACRLENGHLAGGGMLLSQAFARWVSQEALHRRETIEKVLKNSLNHVIQQPMAAIGMPLKYLPSGKVQWVLAGRTANSAKLQAQVSVSI